MADRFYFEPPEPCLAEQRAQIVEIDPRLAMRFLGSKPKTSLEEQRRYFDFGAPPKEVDRG